MGIEDWFSNLGAYQNHPEDLQKIQITRLRHHIPQNKMDHHLYTGEAMGTRAGV